MEYSWQFFRAGGVDQVAIRSGADIAHIGELDQKLWVALACPTRGLEIDSQTLDLIDTDKDGRIRPPELIAACKWACEQLRDPDDLIAGGDTLRLDNIDTSTDAGAELANEARRILDLLGKPDDTVVHLDDVSDRTKLIAAMRFNGDGIITATTPEDPRIQGIVQQIADTQGTLKDLGGADGIDQAKADTFFAHAGALNGWYEGVKGDDAILPLGDATSAASDALEAVRAKIDDFFARCRLAAYDARSTEEMNPSQERYRDIAAQTLSLQSDAISSLPLAPIAPDRALPLSGHGINPAWADGLATFRDKSVLAARAANRLASTASGDLFGETGDDLADGTQDVLTEPDWIALQALLQPYRKWLGTRPATSLDALPLDTIAEMATSDAQQIINGLITDDKAVEPHNAHIIDLEKLLRYKRDLVRLLHNFVSFKSFYRREGAIFEAGTLYLDSRSCDLTIPVADIGKHAALAGLAKACLAYCECTRPDNRKMTIVAAFTAGDTDFLFAGRNGIFYDRQGLDWDAKIIKMIDNPTNVRQAFLSPYKKFIRAIEEQVAKRAAASDANVQSGLGGIAGGIATAGQPAGAAPAAAKTTSSKIDVGTVAALGVALGSISAVIVGIFGKFVELGWWIPAGLLGIILAISGPSMVIAWLKLRERSLGPILDASGWAINGRMKVNVRLGRLISQMARIPLSARHPLKDPYADEHSGRNTIIALLVVVVILIAGWRLGLADNWLVRHGLKAPTPVAAVAPAVAPTPAAAAPARP